SYATGDILVTSVGVRESVAGSRLPSRRRSLMSTMREVAALAGVSAKTVSRVMNNDRYVSDDVRRRVDAAIRELKYVPNTVARTFRSGRDAATGIAGPDISDPSFPPVPHPVELIARRHGVAVFVTSLGTDEAAERT